MTPSERYRIKRWAKFLIYTAKRKRPNRNQKVDIDEEWILKQYLKQNKRCFWTGVELFITHKDHPLKPSLDRLKVEGNYSKNNTVISSKSVNFGRNENSTLELRKFISQIKKNN